MRYPGAEDLNDNDDTRQRRNQDPPSNIILDRLLKVIKSRGARGQLTPDEPLLKLGLWRGRRSAPSRCNAHVMNRITGTGPTALQPCSPAHIRPHLVVSTLNIDIPSIYCFFALLCPQCDVFVFALTE
jgi:hypothetical protein